MVQKLLTESDAVQDQVTSQFVSFRRYDIPHCLTNSDIFLLCLILETQTKVSGVV